MRCEFSLPTVATSILVLGCGTWGCLLLGCNERPHASAAMQVAGRYAPLPGLRASPNASLQAEFELLRQEGATPAQLATAAREGIAPAQRQAAPLAQLNGAFPAFSRKLVEEQIDLLYPRKTLKIPASQRPGTRELLRSQAQARELFRLALPRDGCGLGLPLDQGLLVDLEFLEPLEIGCKLEVLDASEDIMEHRLEQVLTPLEIVLHTAHLLAAEKHLTTRLAAAKTRIEAFRVIERLSSHKFVSSQVLEQLLTVVRAELARWPSDANSLIGERAVGLHTYELVRDGNFASLLTPEEAARLEAQGILHSTIQTALKNIDADELFYLQAMRQLIEASRLPYHQRLATIQQIRQDLTAREQAGAYPLIAGTILLADFEEEQRLIAEDLARMQAWEFALSLALKRATATTAHVNPLTGKPFVVVEERQHVRVGAIFPNRPDTIRLHVQLGNLFADQSK